MLGVYLEIGDEPLQIKKRLTSLGRRIKEICRIGHDHIQYDFDLKDRQNVSMVCQKALPFLGEMEKIMEDHRIRIDDSLGILDFCKGNTSYRRFRHWLESKEAQDT